jgi:sec-independent protein translocase protein TatA
MPVPMIAVRIRWGKQAAARQMSKSKADSSFPLYSPAPETQVSRNMPALHYPLLSVFGLGGPELLIILAVLILLFGAKKLPELAKGLGKSVNEFKKASKDTEAAKEDDEPSEADLKAQLAAAKAELAAAKAAKPADSTKSHGNN